MLAKDFIKRQRERLELDDKYNDTLISYSSSLGLNVNKEDRSIHKGILTIKLKGNNICFYVSDVFFDKIELHMLSVEFSLFLFNLSLIPELTDEYECYTILRELYDNGYIFNGRLCFHLLTKRGESCEYLKTYGDTLRVGSQNYGVFSFKGKEMHYKNKWCDLENEPIWFIMGYIGALI